MSPTQQLSNLIFETLGTLLTGILSSFTTLFFTTILTPLINSLLASLGLTTA